MKKWRPAGKKEESKKEEEDEKAKQAELLKK